MTKEQVYSTNLVLSAGLIIISLIFQKLDVLKHVGLAVMILTAANDTVGLWIAKAWMGFGKILGNINGKIILSVFFFVLLVPIAGLKKLLNKKPLNTNTKWIQLKEDSTFDFSKPW
jgi:hypothetical protein